MSSPDAPLMLGVSGLRGIVGKSLTPEVAARFAGSVGAWLVERELSRSRKSPTPPRIVLGSDGRAGGASIVHAAISGLLAAGCDVTNAGVAMTPSVGTMTDALGAAAGLIITASHNPQEWNGIKVLLRAPRARRGTPDACAPDATTAEQIIARFKSPRSPYVPWDRIDGGPTYEEDSTAHASAIKAALRTLPGRNRYRRGGPLVALDSVGGAGGCWTAEFLTTSLGCTVKGSGEYVDGLFTHAAEPTRENLKGFARSVARHDAAIGFAQDPDADRLAVIDEGGEYIGEEYTLALAAEALLSVGKAKGRVLVANLSSSRMIDDIAAKYGARVVRTPVGEANVVEAMKREKAAGHDVVLGGEGNGGVIWPKVTYVRDSLSAMALVLGLMARTGKKVSELVAAIPAYAIEKRKVELARKEDAKPAVEKIAAAYRDQKVDLQDGVRVDWLQKKAWLHVRASNTEPIMRLIAESPTAAQSRAILDEAARVIAG